MDSKRASFSVLLFPWLAHGHISPFLELAKKLSKRNIHVYLCSTPINFVSIKNRVTEKYSNSIQLVELHLPSLPDLPPHYHTTNGLPIHLNYTLKKALKMAKPTFSNILKNLKPDVLIHDILQPWAAGVASLENIPAISFLLSSAAMIAFGVHEFRNLDDEFPFPDLQLRDYEANKVRQMIKDARKDAEEDRESDDGGTQRASDLILIKTFKEIEDKYINYLSDLFKRDIMPVGPLVQDPIDDEDRASEEVFEWLSKKEKFSTVFVSFGSEYFLSNEEIEEIAHGLELSNVNFIWVIRFPAGKKIRVDEVLPEGFLEKVTERGMVVEGWAPQAKILRHSSIGGFVSHCGWSSVLESMKFGVPIIAMPMHLDQPLNAKVVVEVGGGAEVVRDENGRLHREEVARVIREVVVEKNGEEVRKKTRELSENMRLRGDIEIDALMDVLLKLIEKNKV